MVSSATAKVTTEKYQAYAAYWQQRKAEKRSRLKNRHQAGLACAKGLADILKTDFGATKVALFGSMLSVNNIHMHSDIDIAVWNLSSGDYIKALTALMSNSGEFSVDLVRIEEAPHSLKHYIDSEGRVIGAVIPQSDELTRDTFSVRTHAVLVVSINRELEHIAVQYVDTAAQLNVAKEANQNAYWVAVSLGLHSLYTALEHIFEKIALNVDGDLGEGKRWHKDLIEQMALTIPGARTAVIDTQTLKALTQCLAFRHVVRSTHFYRLKSDQIETVFQNFEDCYGSLVHQLNDFCDFLSSID